MDLSLIYCIWDPIVRVGTHFVPQVPKLFWGILLHWHNVPSKMYPTALKTTAWMSCAAFSKSTISQLKYFFYAIVKSETEKLLCSKQMFWVFSQEHTLLSPAQQNLDSFNFQAFLISLNSNSLRRKLRVFRWSHVFEAKGRSAFKLICLYNFLLFNYMGLLPEITCRYIFHAANTIT